MSVLDTFFFENDPFDEPKKIFTTTIFNNNNLTQYQSATHKQSITLFTPTLHWLPGGRKWAKLGVHVFSIIIINMVSLQLI